MSETINDRIEMLVNEHFGGNKAAFAKSIGYAPTGMSSYISKQRRSKPSVDMVKRIITALDVDARWLLTGEEAPKQEHYVQHGDGALMAKTIHHLEVDQRKIGEEKKIDEHVAVTEEFVLSPDCPEETRHTVTNMQLQIEMLNRLIIEKDERIAELKERINELKQN